MRCLREGEPQFVPRSWSGEKEHSHPGYLAGSVAEQIKQEMCQLVKVNINELKIQHLFLIVNNISTNSNKIFIENL